MTFEPSPEQIDAWTAREQEWVDLRRKYRAMGWWAAWGAVLRNSLGVTLLDWSERILSPGVSPTTREQFCRLFTDLHLDADAANEGLVERADIERKELKRLLRR